MAITAQRKKGFLPGDPRNPGGVLGNAGRGNKVFTREFQEKFLRLYSSGNHNVESAARKIGFKRRTIYNQIEKSERFAAEFEKARAMSMHGIGDRMHAFAIGIEVPAHQSQLTSMFGVLRAFQPERWRENMKITHDAAGDFATFLQGMSSALAAASAARSLPTDSGAPPALEHKE
jgi:hypothetical protein